MEDMGKYLAGSVKPGAPITILPQDHPDLGVRGLSPPPPEAIPVPDSPALPNQLPSVQLPPVVPSRGTDCTPSQLPVAVHRRFDHLPYGQNHEFRKRRGYNGEDSKEVARTRFASMEKKKTGAY